MRSASAASAAVETIAALALDFCPSWNCGNSRIQQVGDDEAEHGVAEKLQRLVVDDAAGRVLVGLGLVGERVLQQPGIAEAVAEPALEGGERLAERQDDAGRHLLAMVGDDAPRLLGKLRRHRDADLDQAVDVEREDGGRRAGRRNGVDAVRLEQPAHDAGLDFRVRPEDDGPVHQN